MDDRFLDTYFHAFMRQVVKRVSEGNKEELPHLKNFLGEKIRQINTEKEYIGWYLSKDWEDT